MREAEVIADLTIEVRRRQTVGVNISIRRLCGSLEYVGFIYVASVRNAIDHVISIESVQNSSLRHQVQ